VAAARGASLCRNNLGGLNLSPIEATCVPIGRAFLHGTASGFIELLVVIPTFFGRHRATAEAQLR
jgi:hypothetical protein